MLHGTTRLIFIHIRNRMAASFHCNRGKRASVLIDTLNVENLLTVLADEQKQLTVT
jgi:hypothetical protein